MPEKHEMEYVPVGFEAGKKRPRGLRFILERLFPRLLRPPGACPFCGRLPENAEREKVIEF